MKLWTPAYGKRMTEARSAGKHPRGVVLVTLGLWVGRPWPQDHLLVVPDEAPSGRLDLRMLAGCTCNVLLATEGEPGTVLSAAQQKERARQRLRGAEVADAAWAAGAMVLFLLDAQSRWSASSFPRREPRWMPVPEYEFAMYRDSGIAWSPALRRSAA